MAVLKIKAASKKRVKICLLCDGFFSFSVVQQIIIYVPYILTKVYAT